MRLDKWGRYSFLGYAPTMELTCMDGQMTIRRGAEEEEQTTAKASAAVKEGDILEIGFGTKAVKVEVLNVQETVKKDDAKEMYKYL